ncbi:polysaccharide biosynthesis tyrosine autokinase [Candidatus Daviesbacteria bacterium]|nr:polysaccharide biosynthesis tyrosine autokinase [Candidatus Daviesbacteria bacterium]
MTEFREGEASLVDWADMSFDLSRPISRILSPKSLALIAASGAVASSVVWAIFSQQPDQYEVTSRIRIGSGNVSQAQAKASGAVDDYIEIIKGRTVIAQTQEKLGIDPRDKTSEFQVKLSRTTNRTTELVDLSTQSNDPILAYRSNREILDVSQKLIREREAKKFDQGRGSINKQIENLERQLTLIQSQGAGESEIKSLEQRLADLRDELAKSYLNEALNADQISIIEAPQFPEKPLDKRLTSTAVLGGVLGALLTTLVIGGASALDRRVKTAEQVRNILGVNVLGEIVKLRKGKDSDLWSYRGPNAEDFRRIREKLPFISPDKKLEIIAITSSDKEEGKSTVVLGLAESISKSTEPGKAGKKKILVIDCDLRLPTIGEKTNVRSNYGLSDIVVGKSDFESAVRRVEGHDFDVLIAGTAGSELPDPTSIFNQGFDEVLRQAREKYDIVLLDCPPHRAGSEVMLITQKADATLLVIDSAATADTNVRRAYQDLAVVNVKIKGVILNNVSGKGRSSYYYYGIQDEGSIISRGIRRIKGIF